MYKSLKNKKRKNKNYEYVGITGFEPVLRDSETLLLPLQYIPIKSISLLSYI